MNKQLNTAIMILLIIVIVGLSFMLIQNQKIIDQQKAQIATQQQKITDLEGQVKELQTKQNTVNSVINTATGIIKEKGTQIIQERLQQK